MWKNFIIWILKEQEPKTLEAETVFLHSAFNSVNGRGG